MKIEIKKSPVKWAGGKGQLLDRLIPMIPKKFNLYAEPFVGGGALFFNIRPQPAILIDLNAELINFYTIVRDDVESLIEDLKKHKNEIEYYYMMRSLNPESMAPVHRASRFLYLNKTSYNGLWRVNKKGKFNVPFGRYKNPVFLNENNLRESSLSLKHTVILCGDFTMIIDRVKSNDFIYFDPPYYPLTKTSNFTSYSGPFKTEDQIRLAECFRTLDQKGCFLMLSNSDTPFTRTLYKNYDLKIVEARRMINSKADNRGEINEIVVRNFS